MTYNISKNDVVEKKAMFYGCIPLFSYMDLGQMPVAAAIAAAARISSRRPGYGWHPQKNVFFL